jgi:hypothetical protein
MNYECRLRNPLILQTSPLDSHLVCAHHDHITVRLIIEELQGGGTDASTGSS